MASAITDVAKPASLDQFKHNSRTEEIFLRNEKVDRREGRLHGI